MYKSLKLIVTGKIQGVGFRPFIYSVSNKYHIVGSVQNNLDRVTIIAEGEEEALLEMVREIKLLPPPLSKIDEVHIYPVAPSFYKESQLPA